MLHQQQQQQSVSQVGYCSPGQLVVDLPCTHNYTPYPFRWQQEGLPRLLVHAHVACVVASLAIINDTVEEGPDREVLEGTAAGPMVQQVPACTTHTNTGQGASRASRDPARKCRTLETAHRACYAQESSCWYEVSNKLAAAASGSALTMHA
jgi:hypothetical protein